MGKFLDALKNLGNKLNGTTPSSTTTVAVINEIAEDYVAPQAVLTAGDNITIENNVISATGGSSGALYLYGIWDGENEFKISCIYSSHYLDIFEAIPSVVYGFSEATQEVLGKLFNFLKSMVDYDGNIYSIGVDSTHNTTISYDNSTETITIGFYYNGSLTRSFTLTNTNGIYSYTGDLYIDITQV